MENKIYLFDTTLRDGQQTTGVNFSVSDKMIISNALDELGIDFAVGSAVSNAMWLSVYIFMYGI